MPNTRHPYLTALPARTPTPAIAVPVEDVEKVTSRRRFKCALLLNKKKNVEKLTNQSDELSAAKIAVKGQ
jgi:hypothetical protein